MAKTAGLRACTSGPVPKALAQLNAVEGCLGEPIEASGHLMFRCFAAWRLAFHVAVEPKR